VALATVAPTFGEHSPLLIAHTVAAGRAVRLRPNHAVVSVLWNLVALSWCDGGSRFDGRHHDVRATDGELSDPSRDVAAKTRLCRK
jgi:hypothetical protein